MNKFPIIICGSGNSIPFLNSQYYRTHCGLPQELVDIIKGNYSIGLNHWERYGCKATFTSFVDYQFYLDNKEFLKNISLIIGSHSLQLKRHGEDNTYPNTILLKDSGIYNGKESIEKGIYTHQLVGIWALSLAIGLGFEEIYLLGYDACEINGQTHFYQGVIDLNKKVPEYVNGKHVNDRYIFGGIGKKENGTYKTSTYNIKKHLNQNWFAPFHAERKKLKIYNVSPESAIDVFEKIDYETFYAKVKNNHIFQDQARACITEQIYSNLK